MIVTTIRNIKMRQWVPLAVCILTITIMGCISYLSSNHGDVKLAKIKTYINSVHSSNTNHSGHYNDILDNNITRETQSPTLTFENNTHKVHQVNQVNQLIINQVNDPIILPQMDEWHRRWKECGDKWLDELEFENEKARKYKTCLVDTETLAHHVGYGNKILSNGMSFYIAYINKCQMDIYWEWDENKCIIVNYTNYSNYNCNFKVPLLHYIYPSAHKCNKNSTYLLLLPL